MDSPFNTNHSVNNPLDLSSSQVSGTLPVGKLPTAIPATNLADGSISNVELQSLDNVSSNIQTQINTKLTGSTSTVETLLSSTAGVDLNTTNKTNLYTVPVGKTFIPTRIVTRNVSISLTTAVFGFGFNANANDVVSAASHATLTGNTLMSIDVPIAGAKVGAAADVFGVKCSVAQGVAATATIDVFGYLV